MPLFERNYIYMKRVGRQSKKSGRKKYFSSGKSPLTERGKRRQLNRTDMEKEHAKKVWSGGYELE